jgi:hypothetical protein
VEEGDQYVGLSLRKRCPRVYPKKGSELIYGKENIEDMLERQLIVRSKITPVILATPVCRWYHIPMNNVSFRIGEFLTKADLLEVFQK